MREVSEAFDPNGGGGGENKPTELISNFSSNNYKNDNDNVDQPLLV